VKFTAEAEDWQTVASGLLRGQLLVALGAAALLATVAPVIAFWLDAPELSTYLRLFSLDIPIHAFSGIHRSFLVGRGYYGRRALLTGAFWLTRMVLVVLFVSLSPSIVAAVLGIMGTSFVLLLGARFFIRPSLLRRSTLSLRDLWDYTWPIFFYTLGVSLFRRLDLLFVKGLSGVPEAAGFYGAAQNMSIVPGLFAGSLSPLLLAKLSWLSGQDQGEPARVMTRQAMRIVVCLLPFGAMAAGAAQELVIAIYGARFLPAGPLLSLLIFGALGLTMITVALSTLVAAGLPRLTLVLTGPLVVLAIGIHIIVVPRFGPIGAAAVTTSLAWLGAGSAVLAVFKVWSVAPPAVTLWRSITISAFVYALAVLWQSPGVLLLVKLPAIGGIILLSFLSLGEFSATEISFVRSLIRLPRTTQ
jgi:O-antigen/teichoic acid export membrane protein